MIGRLCQWIVARGLRGFDREITITVRFVEGRPNPAPGAGLDLTRGTPPAPEPVK